MKFTKIPESAFQELVLNAGVLLNTFNPASASEEIPEENFIGATTGGLSFTATPTYSDFGEDIDNCPKNMAELKRLDTWDVKLSGTLVTASAKSVKSTLGAADVESDKITPRNVLKDEDFSDIWLVADYSDKNGEKNGGHVAIHMMKALSTAGFQLKTSDKAKGQFAFEYTAHYTLATQDTPPFEIYVKTGTEEES